MHAKGELDFEDIGSMGILGNLLYKLEHSSKEFEVYHQEFHRILKTETSTEFMKSQALLVLYLCLMYLNVACLGTRNRGLPHLTSLKILIMNHFAWTFLYQKPVFLLEMFRW